MWSKVVSTRAFELLGVGHPKGSIYTTIMELGPKNHNMNGLLGPNSILVVYMDPSGTACSEPAFGSEHVSTSVFSHPCLHYHFSCQTLLCLAPMMLPDLDFSAASEESKRNALASRINMQVFHTGLCSFKFGLDLELSLGFSSLHH